MSDRAWNIHQQKAIDTRGGSVVVSAAAGSGKTSVLTERVMRLIEQGEDIENMLIVTFTNLAASEMRERIFRRFQDAGTHTPRLAAQAEKCAFADISTIHAFCSRVIRDNFAQAGVSPTFAVADEASIRRLKQDAMDQVVAQAMRQERLRRAAARYSARGDLQRIQDVVFAMYHHVISLRHPQQWLDASGERLGSRAFARVLFEEFKRMVCDAAGEAAQYLLARSALWRDKGFPAEADASDADRTRLVQAAQAVCIGDVRLPEAVQIGTQAKSAPNRESASLTNNANGCFDGLGDYSGDFLAKVTDELESTAENGAMFIDLAQAFMKRYADAKRRKNVLDHDDLIHFALKALGHPDIAERYRRRYAHVFVDEYQDINDAQDAVIKRIQREGNDFLVGDVKQCIYMFRESNPELLIRRCGELAGKGLVEMNVNYRSAPPVIDFINGVMQFMMTEDAGGVAYTGGQCLAAGREGAGGVEIVLAGSEQDDSIAAEAAEIGNLIKRLTAQGYAYRDIAILRPEVKGSGRQLARTLSQMDIPVLSAAESVETAFSEAGVFVNLLSLIDSPTSDIALLSVMRYPHFGFTEPELAAIRLAQGAQAQDQSFCHTVYAFAQDSALGQKVRRFIDEIEHYRLLSQCLQLPDFLMRLAQEAEFREYALTSPGGRGSDSAVAAFISAASSLKAAQLADVIDIADKIGTAKEQPRPGEANAVYITTIHKAKGLEFPVVILSGMHKHINVSEASGPVLVSRALGLALDTIDERMHIRRPTLHKRAAARSMRRDKLSETVRLLYVGMTRAVERLVISGAGAGIKERWLQPKYAGWQHDAVTYFDLIMPAAAMMCRQNGADLCEIVRIADSGAAEAQTADKAQRLAALFDSARAAEPEALFDGYAFERDLGMPSKVSVSALKRQGEREVLRPVFPPAEQADIPAAERGTLMHKVLQNIGFDRKSPQEVDACVQALVQQGTIDDALQKHVDAQAISAFLQSDLAARSRRAQRRWVEQPFCLRMRAKEAGLGASEELVVVQGVIDLCFLENGSWVVVDYKTDRIDKNAADVAAQKYALQLGLYARALERITNCKVKEKHIYFLAAGMQVTLP